MNIKTVSSAYFMPLTQTTVQGETFTHWVNLAKVQNIVFHDNEETVTIFYTVDDYEEFGSSAYHSLKSEVEFIYRNTRMKED